MENGAEINENVCKNHRRVHTFLKIHARIPPGSHLTVLWLHASQHFGVVARLSNESIESCRGAVFTLRPPRAIIGRVRARRAQKWLVGPLPNRAPAQNSRFPVRARKMIDFRALRLEIFARAFALDANGALKHYLSILSRAFAARRRAKVCAAFAKYNVMCARRLRGSGACVGAVTSPSTLFFRAHCAVDYHTISYVTDILRAPSVSRCSRRTPSMGWLLRVAAPRLGAT